MIKDYFKKILNIVDLKCCVNFCYMASSVIHIHKYIYIYSFSYSFPLWFIIEEDYFSPYSLPEKNPAQVFIAKIQTLKEVSWLYSLFNYGIRILKWNIGIGVRWVSGDTSWTQFIFSIPDGDSGMKCSSWSDTRQYM